MNSDEITVKHDIYPNHLKVIANIHFTQREIDIISCLLNARGTSKIASLLSIAPRTVGTHTRNIMLKLGCNSREGIIDFVEKSGKFSIVRRHYVSLLIQEEFRKCLREIKKLTREITLTSLIIYWRDPNLKNILIHHLRDHLVQGGISAEIREEFILESAKKPDCSLLFLLEKKELQGLPQGLASFNSIDLESQKNYYFFVIEVIKKLFSSNTKLEEIIRGFKENYEAIEGDSELRLSRYHLEEEKSVKKENDFGYKIREIFRDRKLKLALMLLVIGFFGIGFLVFQEGEKFSQNFFQIHNIKQKTEEAPIRSDLIIPTESSLLFRPELIAQLNNKLRDQNGIQAVALVGPGGAGKTILARQYAHQQKSSIIWEINAETHETLTSSFEDLAQAFTTTEEDKKTLKQIQDIKNVEARERKIIQFVKKYLSSHPNWFLIFDNVEKFTDIQKHFPQDFVTWGQGKIILTTRDSNIKNNKYISSVIQIGELSPEQKAHLFIKIITHQNDTSFTPIQSEKIKAFLEYIPPFPLDVSVAAYYLKTTQIPYAAYLENLTKYNKGFESVQQNLLKEAGEYSKTRYGIISLSLEHMINTHKDFVDLLLFISLIDSQNIPRDLLAKYKNMTTVDNFIYNLKKHSLIISQITLSSSKGPTFSIHRSTQAIILAHLTKLLSLEKNKYYIEQIGVTFRNYAAEAIDKRIFPKMNLLARHCEMFLSRSNVLTSSIIAFICCELGGIYYNQSKYVKAKQLYKKSLIIYRKQFFKNNLWFARALIGLGNVYNDLDNYKEAKQLYEESILIYRKNSYETHPWFAWALGCLGNVYRALDDFEKAKKLLEESLIVYKKNSFENDPLFARTLGWLGNVYKDLGNYDKAKQIYEESLTIYRKNAYENHPWFARTLARLGYIYRKQGNYKKAKELLEESLVVYRKNSFENHPLLARTLVELGNVYREEGNFEKAKQLLEKSLTIQEHIFSKNHSKIAENLLSLGIIYRELSNYAKAKDLFECSLEIYEKILGKNHIEVARVLEELGQNHLLEGNIPIAEEHLHSALNIFQKNNHSDAYIAFEKLAELYFQKATIEANNENSRQSKIFKDQGNSYLKKALDILKANFPQGYPHIIRIESRLKKMEKKSS